MATCLAKLRARLLTVDAVYIGDSAALSYLQLIRIIVENVSGQSKFTMDPRRHRIMENTITLPPNIRPLQLLPDCQTAEILIESYFTNVCQPKIRF